MCVDQGPVVIRDHIAIWHAKLAAGHNRIEASTGAIKDAVDWIYQP